MAKSNLLREAIADAKTVRETAIANAKIALEEAFTPKLQSMLSEKLKSEMDGDEDDEDVDVDVNEEYGAEDAPTAGSSKVGKGKNGTDSGTDNKQPSGDATKSHTKLDPETSKETAAVGMEEEDYEKAKVSEGGVETDVDDPHAANDDMEDVNVDESEDVDDDEELDLDEIIKELESELDDDDDDDEEIDESVNESDDEEYEDEDDEEIDESVNESDDEEDDDEEIDLDEILREMGYGDDEEEDDDEDESSTNEELERVQGELQEAYSTIKELKSTINEVNLLNAKLLYTNKLFRSYELTNEQKMKVVETLDRTSNVREVKLVFSTLAESLKLSGNSRKQTKVAKSISEGFASKAQASTAPKKEIISESNELANRFKKLANIKN